MNFKVHDEIFKDFPDLRIALIVLRSSDNLRSDGKITALLRKTEEVIFEKFADLPVSTNHTIKRWREAYKKFGAKDYTSSVESLVRRVSKGKSLPEINNFVNLYNLISLKYILPLGGEDLEKIEGDLELRKASGEEKFVPLFENENNPPKQGEIIYADKNNVICRAWNWREADKTKLTSGTRNAIFVIESLDPSERLSEAAGELKELLVQFCGGNAEVKLISIDHKEVVV